MFAGTITIVGCWLRSLVELNENFATVFWFTLLTAVGYPFFVQTSSRIATLWFGDKEVNTIQFNT